MEGGDMMLCFSLLMVDIMFLLMQPINLNGEKYLLKGHITVDLDKNLPDDIPVDIFDNQETLVGSTTARFVSSKADAPGASVYEYSVWAKFGEKLSFVPQDSRYVYFGSFCYIQNQRFPTSKSISYFSVCFFCEIDLINNTATLIKEGLRFTLILL